jgi:acetyl esterase
VAADSQRLERALLRLQSDCSAHYYVGEPHAFHVMFWRPNAVRCWRDSFEYLDRLLPAEVDTAQRGSP